MALTPATRRRPGHSSAASGSHRVASGPRSSGCGETTPVVGGMIPVPRASTALISPAAPAAARACPMLALIEPSAAGSRAPARSSDSASSSASSPAAVPLPCPSIRRASRGSTPARS